MSERTCSHCGGPQQGSAGISWGIVHYDLCHPDEGMDCYHLVTVYRHPVVGCPCVMGIAPSSVAAIVRCTCGNPECDLAWHDLDPMEET